MSLQESVLKLFEKTIDMIGEEDNEFPDEDFSSMFKDTFKNIIKETSKFSKMDANELKKRLEEIEVENKNLKNRVAELEQQLANKLRMDLDLD
jgi:hypothetical protein